MNELQNLGYSNIEKKIKELSGFSPTLEGILMSIMRDNEELKNILRLGFKEIERELQDLDMTFRKEKEKERSEVEQVKTSLEQNFEVVRQQIGSVEQQCDELAEIINVKSGDFERALLDTSKSQQEALEIYKDNVDYQMKKESEESSSRIDDLNSRISEQSAELENCRKDLLKSVGAQRRDVEDLVGMATEAVQKKIEAEKCNLLELLEVEKEERNIDSREIRLNLEAGVRQVKNELVNDVDDIKSNLSKTGDELKCALETANARLKSDFGQLQERLTDDIDSRFSDMKGKMDDFEAGNNKLKEDTKDHVDFTEKNIKMLGSAIDEQSKSVNETLLKTITDFENKNLMNKKDILEVIKDETVLRERESQENKANYERSLEDIREVLKNQHSSLEEQFLQGEKRLEDDLRRELQNNETMTNTLKDKIDSEVRSVKDMVEVNQEELKKWIAAESEGQDKKAAALGEDFEKRFEKERSELCAILERLQLENEEQKLENSQLRERSSKEREQLRSQLQINMDDLRSDLADHRKKITEAVTGDIEGLQRQLQKGNAEKFNQFKDLEELVLDQNRRRDDELEKTRHSFHRETTKLRDLILLPGSIYFNAIREEAYNDGGEEYLTFSRCSLNCGGGMDAKSGVFLVPEGRSGVYLFSLTVCSLDMKKVLVSLRRNGEEEASIFDQNHDNNHRNSMLSQSVILDLKENDQIQLYLYTFTGLNDFSNNHYTQFIGFLLRPSIF